jgi:S1-C subfamily serine protease
LLLTYPTAVATGQVSSETALALKPSTVAEAIKPAVVRIFNFGNVTLSSPFPAVDLQSLQQRIGELADQRSLDSKDPRAVLDTLISLMQQDPTTYIVPLTETVNFAMPQLTSGSGFIVTPNGYIVTNAHVVEAPTVQAIAERIATDANTIVSVFGNQATENVRAVLTELFPQYFPVLASPLEVTSDEQAALFSAFLNTI